MANKKCNSNAVLHWLGNVYDQEFTMRSNSDSRIDEQLQILADMTESRWSKGEEVCLVFLHHVRDSPDRALKNPPELGERTNEVLAYGRIGLTCRTFQEFIQDPIVGQSFAYDIEIFLVDLPLEWFRVHTVIQQTRLVKNLLIFFLTVIVSTLLCLWTRYSIRSLFFFVRGVTSHVL